MDLVDQFYRQIRYGCQNPACVTPTCLSCRKRYAKGPYRRLTVLSARSLATFIASEENAEHKLCPHTPQSSVQPHDRVFIKDGTLSSIPVAENKPASTKEKDPKSLSQHLFDTNAFRYSEVAREHGMSSQHVTSESLFHPIFSTQWNRLSTMFPSVTNNKQMFEDEVMHGKQAAEAFTQALRALHMSFVALISSTSQATFDLFARLHRSGHLVPDRSVDRTSVDSVLEMISCYQDKPALRLAVKLARVFAALRCWDVNERHSISSVKNLQYKTGTDNRFTTFRHLVVNDLNNSENSQAVPSRNLMEALKGGEISYAAVVLEWMRTVILHEWDGRAIIHRYGAIGGAIDFISLLYEQRHNLGLSEDSFSMSFLSDRLDPMETPVEWSAWQSMKETTHLLSFPFLFTPATLVTYLRALNYASMVKAFEESWATTQLITRISPIARTDLLEGRLKIATNSYLVLEIRRDSILMDAMNQLWRRQKRELLRPLKIRMGMEEGEEGVDHGGVQQEFFRIVFAEALNPDYGLFTTDPATQMSWFRVDSLEPEYKYELLGLLVSLAVYNGLTLPINFPLVLYRKLLQLSVTELDHIQDGWPDLAKGLSQLLSWSDGDVADVFMRQYVFSAETIDSITHVDMEQYQHGSGPRHRFDVFHFGKESGSYRQDNLNKEQSVSDDWSCLPSSSSDGQLSSHHSDPHLPNTEYSGQGATDNSMAGKPAHTESDLPLDGASMVTNANRKNYVRDYIYWLTDRSIRRQYEAFARGFHHCVDKNALQIFTPEAFRNVVEGGRNINLDELEATTRYENGYSAQHRVIRDFWFVVRSFSEEQVQKLLEFVTASDRVPVKGISSMVFIVQRNGTSDERLPTSLTCFGRLLLPEYSTREILQEKLGLAIENCKGFGVA